MSDGEPTRPGGRGEEKCGLTHKSPGCGTAVTKPLSRSSLRKATRRTTSDGEPTRPVRRRGAWGVGQHTGGMAEQLVPKNATRREMSTGEDARPV